MKKEYSILFTPWKIGNVEIKNRFVMTSMGGTSIFGWMEPCHFDKEAAKFLLERAKNNVGLILPGIAPIRDPMLNRYLYTNKKMFRDLKKYMVEFHKTGAKLFIQLTAGFGRSFAVTSLMEKLQNNKVLNVLAKPILNIDYLCASCSETPNRWSDKITSKQMSIKDIQKMIHAFVETAKLCKEAGVDGVEIHAVHEGYLLDQFTLKYANLRTDEYGGSFENRYRFPVEIVKAIKNACGNDFPVSLRYSVVSKTKGFRQGALPNEEYVEAGRDLEEGVKAAQYLQDAGYDMLNCDNGTYDAWYWAHPPIYMPSDCNLKEVSYIKKYVKIPVVCAGKMTPLTASQAIENNELDAMGVARQFLVDPSWITKLKEDREDDIMPCICCHNGCFNMAYHKGSANDQDLADAIHMSRCALNPQTMQSKKYYIKKAKKSLNIAVIGGGIGGMEVARVATLRGHNVTIYEKSNQLGGVYIAASNMSFKEKDKQLIEWFKKQIKDLNINVVFNKEIKDLNEIKADKVVMAVGSKPNKIPVKGIENTINAVEFLTKDIDVGQKPIIIGGGLTGCEIAYELSLQGKEPTIVEMKDDLIPVKGVCMANSTYLREYFALHKVPVYLNNKLTEVTSDGVIIKDLENKSTEIKGTKVIVSAGYRPAPIFENKKVLNVGDSYKVGNLRTVIWRAWDVAMKL